MSLGGILSIARSALIANQAAMGVVSHNIANASTEGYSRQRADLVASPPLITPQGVIGTGVTVNDISRARDSLLDVAFRNESGTHGFASRRASLLGEIQALHGDLNTPGLGQALDSFWNAWSDLANNPGSSTARVVVKQAGSEVVNQFNRIASGLVTLAESADRRLRADIDTFNQLAQTVANLNERIVSAEVGGRTAGDLRDARDLAIDQMAAITGVQVIERSDGSVAVNVNGIGVVDGNQSNALRVATQAGVWSLSTVAGTTVGGASGSVGAGMQVLNTDIPAARAELDALARALAASVNAAHQTGTNAAGATGLSFFEDNGDPATVTAGSLRLSSDIADAQAIAAGTGVPDPLGGPDVYASGRNDVAQLLASLRDSPAPGLGTRSLAEAYAASIGRIGSDLRAASDSAQVHDALMFQTETRRSSVSGVSLDEELVQLIRFQNAFAAAARVVSAADEMLQTLIGMKR